MPVFDRSAGTCVDKAIGTLGCRGLVGGRSHVVSIRRCPRRPMSRFAGRLRRSIRTCCRTLPVPCPANHYVLLGPLVPRCSRLACIYYIILSMDETSAEGNASET